MSLLLVKCLHAINGLEKRKQNKSPPPGYATSACSNPTSAFVDSGPACLLHVTCSSDPTLFLSS